MVLGPDLQFNHNYSGKFLATTSATGTLSSRFHGSEDTDKLVVMPDSAATDDTENEGTQFNGLNTLTCSDITCSEKLLKEERKQMSGRALQDSVEKIIARFRNECQALFERHQIARDYKISVILKSLEPASETKQPAKLIDPDFILPQKQRTDDKQLGLAGRVHKILTTEQDKEQETDDHEEKGMAKKVNKILSTEQPQEQVDGMLPATMAEEHEMVKKMAMAQVDKSSADNNGLNESEDSFSIDNQNVRKCLQWSQLSSPKKGNKSDFAMVREVTSLPYSTLNNANSLLSKQLKKMSETNFDKSTELQTPYQQAYDSEHLYQLDREINVHTKIVRETWMPTRKGSSLDMAPALSRPVPSTENFTIKSSWHLTKALPLENISRSLEPSEFPVRPLEPGGDPRSLNQRLASEVRPALSDLAHMNIHRSADARDLEHDFDPVHVPTTQALRSDAMMDAVELGADPRMMATVRHSVNDAAIRGRSKSPLHIKQKEMEVELGKLNKHLSDQITEIQEPNKLADKKSEDNFPPSKKAQELQKFLEHEYMENQPPNINDVWSHFKETKEQSMSDNSLNSTQLDTVVDLLKNPTQYAVNSLIKERTKLNKKKKIDKKENFDNFKEEDSLEIEKPKKRVDVKAIEDRRLRCQETKQWHGTSGKDSDGSYLEILIEKERKKEICEGDQRSNDEKKSSRKKRSKSSINKSPHSVENDVYAKDQKNDDFCLTDISTCAPPTGAKHVDNMDMLFSISEDASFEQSPSNTQSDWKSCLERHRHTFEFLVMKFNNKMKLLRTRIDREKRKELERVKKMKMLLTTHKRKGLLSGKAISVELENVSFGTSDFETSHAMSDLTVSDVSSSLESDASMHISDSSCLNESSIDSNVKLQVKQYPESVIGIKKHVMEYTSTDSSDFSNVVERIPKNKSEKRTKDRNGHAKGKKVNENENNKNSKDKQNKDIFGVGLSKRDPQRQNKLKQVASTMYASSVRLSPPLNCRLKEVLMKAKAVHISPTVHPTRPTHTYNDVPVATVPYMSNISDISPLRQPTSALSKSIQTSPSRTSSKSLVSKTSCKSSQVSKSSRSSAARKSSKSPALSRRDMSPAMIQKRVLTPNHKPKDNVMLPKNSMFSSENDENSLPLKFKAL